MVEKVFKGELMQSAEDTQNELKDALEEIKAKIDRISDQLERNRNRKAQSRFDQDLDFVTSTAKAAIDDFSTRDESIKIENITPKYLSFAIDKILELSDDVVIFAGTEDFINPYFSTAIKESAGKKINIYSGDEKYKSLDTDHIDVHILPSDIVEALRNDNIRNAIVGDKQRFMVEKPNEVPGAHLSLRQVFNRLLSFKHEHPKMPKQYESLINFHDNFSAGKIVDRIISTPKSQSLALN